MIRAILIDVDNTLLDFNRCAESVIRAGFAEHGIPYGPDVFPVFTRVNDALWRRLERGELTRERLHAVRFSLIFQQLGVEQDAEAFERRFVEGLAQSHEPVPGALALVKYLSENYITCVASNAAHAHQLRRLSLAGMLPYFHHVFTSEQVGFTKPSEAFFAACFAALPGILPKETLLIGDSLSADIQGGADFGVQTCWFNPGGLDQPASPRPDFTVTRLDEIQRIL